MQLTRYTDFGLRVLIFLSLQETGRRVTITEISERFDIPRNHLVKVVHRLGQLKYIHTSRGKNGGIHLAQASSDIRVGDVVRQMESRLDIIDCTSPGPCPIQASCHLKSIVHQASDAFLNVLDKYTIADLQKSPNQLKLLLQL